MKKEYNRDITVILILAAALLAICLLFPGCATRGEHQKLKGHYLNNMKTIAKVLNNHSAEIKRIKNQRSVEEDGEQVTDV